MSRYALKYNYRNEQKALLNKTPRGIKEKNMEELIELIEILDKLSEEEQWAIYFMIIGANMVRDLEGR